MEDKSVQVNKEREISIDEENSCLEKEITSELNKEEYDKLYKESFLYNKIVNSDIIKNIKTYLIGAESKQFHKNIFSAAYYIYKPIYFSFSKILIASLL